MNSTLTKAQAIEEKSDKNLIESVCNGSKKDFRILLERYNANVFHVILGMVKNRDIAEELTQETFIKVYKSLNTFDTERSFKPWLLRIASNTTISYIRKNSKIVSLDAINEAGHWQESEQSPMFQNQTEDHWSQLNRKYQTQELLSTMQQLDPKFRQVLSLRHIDDMPYDEIAETMDIPINTVRTWLRRGRNKLMTLIKDKDLTD